MALGIAELTLNNYIKDIRPKINELITAFNDLTISENLLSFTGSVSQTGEYIIINDGETQNGSIGKLPGIHIDRGTLDSQILVFDESVDKWKVGVEGNLNSISLDGHTHSEYSLVDHIHSDYLKADGTVSLTGNLNIGLNSIGNQNGNLKFDQSGNVSITKSLTIFDGNNPTSLSLFNTYTDNNNYEKGFVKFEDNILKIGSEYNGTGSFKEMSLSQGNGEIKTFVFSKDINDSTYISLPTFLNSAYGIIVVGNNEERTQFFCDNLGNVVLLNNSSNIVAGSDTALKFCVSTTIPEMPVKLKNNLGSNKKVNIVIFYS